MCQRCISKRPPRYPAGTHPQWIWTGNARPQLPNGINRLGENRRRRLIEAVRTNEAADELAVAFVSPRIGFKPEVQLLHMLREGAGDPYDSVITDEVLKVKRAFLTVDKFR